jgi:hypothetical protein
MNIIYYDHDLAVTCENEYFNLSLAEDTENFVKNISFYKGTIT